MTGKILLEPPQKTIMEKSNNIVFINGCFDALHVGHILFFSDCYNISRQEKCEIVCALDSDLKIEKDKGNDRPIFCWQERKKHIEIVFSNIFIPEIKITFESFNSNKELEDLIQRYNPKFLVKGSSWMDNVVGQKYAEKTIFIPINQDCPSTTEIIKRVVGAYEYTRDR